MVQRWYRQLWWFAGLATIVLLTAVEPALAATQTITLTDSKSQPIANLVVNAYNRQGRFESRAQSDQSGSAAFSLSAGTYELRRLESGGTVGPVLGSLTVSSTGAVSRFNPARGTTVASPSGAAVTLRIAGVTGSVAPPSTSKTSKSKGGGVRSGAAKTPTSGASSSSSNTKASGAGSGSTPTGAFPGPKQIPTGKSSCDDTSLAPPGGDFAHPFGVCLSDYLKNLYSWALVIGAGLAVMMIMWSGYQYVISAGDPEVVRNAKDILQGAILGLLLLLMTYAIANSLRVFPGGGGTTNGNGAAPPTDTTASTSSTTPASGSTSSSGGTSSSAASANATSIAGTYQATIKSISWLGTCPQDIQNKYPKNSSQSVTVTQSGSAITVSTLGKQASGTLVGNVATIPLNENGGSGQMIVTFSPAQSKIGVNVRYQKTVLFVGCQVEATIMGEK